MHGFPFQLVVLVFGCISLDNNYSTVLTQPFLLLWQANMSEAFSSDAETEAPNAPTSYAGRLQELRETKTDIIVSIHEKHLVYQSVNRGLLEAGVQEILAGIKTTGEHTCTCKFIIL